MFFVWKKNCPVSFGNSFLVAQWKLVYLLLMGMPIWRFANFGPNPPLPTFFLSKHKNCLPGFFLPFHCSHPNKTWYIYSLLVCHYDFFKFWPKPPLTGFFYKKKCNRRKSGNNTYEKPLDKKSCPPIMLAWKRVQITWKWLQLPVLMRWMTAGRGGWSNSNLYHIIWTMSGGQG